MKMLMYTYIFLIWTVLISSKYCEVTFSILRNTSKVKVQIQLKLAKEKSSTSVNGSTNVTAAKAKTGTPGIST